MLWLDLAIHSTDYVVLFVSCIFALVLNAEVTIIIIIIFN